MCGRYTLTAPPDLLAEELGVDVPRELAPRYNIAPTQRVPVITDARPHAVQLFRWGLVPSFADGPSKSGPLINARAETLDRKASFRQAFERRRCLVPADGFFEWRDEGDRRRALYFRLASGQLFAFAGLWDVWRGPAGEELPSFAIVTTTPNALVAPVHDRMPVLLHRADFGRWLAPGPLDPSVRARLLSPYPALEMVCHAVSALVNLPANDVPECIAPQ
jgi:putative SOS response-associated peptidase YedK